MILRTVGNIAHDGRSDRFVLFLWLATAAALAPWIVSVLDWFFWLVGEDFRNNLAIGHMRYVAAALTVARWAQQLALIALIGAYLWVRERGTSRQRGHSALTAAVVLMGTALGELAQNLIYIGLNMKSASLMPPGALWDLMRLPILLSAAALLRAAAAVTIPRGGRMALYAVIAVAASTPLTRTGGMAFAAYGTAQPLWKLVVLAMAYYAVLAYLLTRISREDIGEVLTLKESEVE